MSILGQTLALAWQHHQAGNLQLAEQFYRQVLQHDPRHADALHLLGVLACQVGRYELGLDYFDQAIAVNPTNIDFHCNRGVAYRNLGRRAEAVATFRQVLQLAPHCATAFYHLGCLYAEQGQLNEAIAAYRQLLRLQPDHAEAYNNLGAALRQQGQHDEAVACFRQAVSIRPDFWEGQTNLGAALLEQGHPAEAERALLEAVRLQPQNAEVHMSLARVRFRQGRLDEALAGYRQAVQCQPNLADGYYNMGVVHDDLGQVNEAAAAYEQALRCQPDHVNAHNNLAGDYRLMGRLDDVVAVCREALRYHPDSAETYNNLGTALTDQGKIDEAVASLRRAVELRPDFNRAHSNLLLTLNYHPRLDPAALFAEHRRWAEQHEAPLAASRKPHPVEHDPERRLRVGYVSADFRDHAVAFFIEAILAAHDHERFGIYGYANVVRPDAVTQRLRGLADEWRSIFGLSDAAAADLVRRDAIDILVDLSGHTGGNRLLLFARKPAPIQVIYFGYPNTTGLQSIDYRITDAFADPPGMTEAFHSETLVRLPDIAWCYRPPDVSPEVGPLPVDGGGPFTFGSLNNLAKVSTETMELWARILAVVPNSRLLLLATGGRHNNRRTQDTFARFGIGADRAQLLERRPRDQYLGLYNTIDLGLDPFPYNGGVTTCDALWMGVPVLTLAGQSYLARQGISLLSNLGLEELIAPTLEEYAALAVRMAQEHARLRQLRQELRSRMKQSPVTDAPRLVRHLEDAYRLMWRNWCARA